MASQLGERGILTIHNLIGGKATAAASGDWAERRSPVDGSVIAEFARSRHEDAEHAVASGRYAQPSWGARSPVERGTIIRGAAELLKANGDALVDLVCREMGKPRRDAVAELDAAVEMGYFVAGEGRRFYGRTTTSAMPYKDVFLARVPVGIAALIVASNTPLPNYAWKVFPALLCGNAAVLKPSEDTPASAELFGRLMLAAGVPPGVLNIVHGLGPEIGAALVEHPGVDLVSFTGSSGTGRWIQATAGARLAKVSLEMGGKNPFVVCEDAPLPAAARAAAKSAFSNAGQRCAAGSRIIVVEGVYDEFQALLVDETRRLRVGVDNDADLGPVVNERSLGRILAAVDAARRHGATILTGGVRLRGPGYDGGCFMEPTLIADIERGADASQSELFGPVACLYRVEGFVEALACANDSAYGLTAAIHTRSVHRAMTFARGVQAGMVVVNGPTYGSEPHMPFGGVKQSGNGFREAGTESLDVFSEWKNISIIHDPEQV